MSIDLVKNVRRKYTLLWLLPYTYLTGEYLQVRIILKSPRKEPLLQVRDNGKVLPYIATRLVNFSSSRGFKTCIIFIHKSLITKNTSITLVKRNKSITVPIDKDDCESVRNFFTRKNMYKYT